MKNNALLLISALEAEIDQLVYQLYGLTAEEIAIVEMRTIYRRLRPLIASHRGGQKPSANAGRQSAPES